ncbi:MAG: ATP synthase F0 subunit C [Spirochaetota bacterium]|jgi:F-type H+-transporting ATPase subunit c|nr:ATP synthase F0 subunit C [Spirochaetota bacterium]
MDALGAGLSIGLGALGGAIGIGIIVGYAITGIARQPEAMGRIRPLMFIGIAFAEACVLYALVITLILLGRQSEPAAPTPDAPPAITETIAE